MPAMGRLIQKIQRQETYSVKRPPRTGPVPPATAHMSCKSPRYMVRDLIQRGFVRMLTLVLKGSLPKNENLPHAEQIGYYNINKLNESTASHSLKCTAEDEYTHALGRCADN